MEENPVVEPSVEPSEDLQLQELKTINTNLNNILKFFETQKQEQQIQEQEQQKIDEQNQQSLLEEKQVAQEQQTTFYKNIETIANNTGSTLLVENQEDTNATMSDVSTLLQVNIMALGLLIGIVCISFFAKFFKRN